MTERLLTPEEAAVRRAGGAAAAALRAELLAAGPSTSTPPPEVIAEARAKVREPTTAGGLVGAVLADAKRRGASRQVERARDRAKRSDAQKRATAERLRAAAAERDRRFKEESARRGCPDFRPKDLPPAAYEIAERVERNSGNAGRALRGLRGRAFRRSVEIGALGMLRQPDGTRRPTRDLGCIVARRIVACAVVLAYLSEQSQRSGYALLVDGYVRGSLCSLFTNKNRDGAAVSLGTLFATSHGAERKGKWDCGAVVALERAAAIEKHQPPAHKARGCNVGVGRDGKPRALNQYFVRELAITGTPEDAERLEEIASMKWERRQSPAAPRGPPAA